jgi:superfamily I DNA/RNA helicase
MSYQLSTQQQAFVDWVARGRGNAIAEAVAGAGKTSTILRSLPETRGSVAIAAFNNRIADEIKTKVAKLDLGRQIAVGTFHSFGFRTWRNVASRVQVDGDKVRNLMRVMEVDEELRDFVGSAVGMARQVGIGALHPMGDMSAWYGMVAHHDMADKLADAPGAHVSPYLLERALGIAVKVLEASNESCRDVIDFDDMLYAPILFKARFWQNDWLFVDEAQDSNAMRRAVARAMLRPGGRAVFVGDRRQAINGFAGADNDALDQIAREFSTTELPMTVTYRCPKAVVREARMYVDHIVASPTAPEGEVRDIGEFANLFAEQLTPDDAILCRNTAPLVKAAYGLIRRGTACRIEGRDIGAGLLRLATRWKRCKTLPDLREKLVEYMETETVALTAKNKEAKAAALQDQVESLIAVIDGLGHTATVGDLRTRIESMFGDSDKDPRPMVTLCSGHRSKGREWHRVYLVGMNELIPSPFARQDWMVRQEENVAYVMVTRSMGELVYVAAPPRGVR